MPKREQQLEDGVYYHYDTPCTIENQIKMLEAAGFGHIEILREYENNLVVVAR